MRLAILFLVTLCLSETRAAPSPLPASIHAAKSAFVRPDVWNIEIPFENTPAQHATLMQNFVDAIMDGTPLLVPGEEGINSVELANVMLYSSFINQTVELPMDSAAFEKKLNELIGSSKFEKKVTQITSEDFTKSFTR